MPDLYQEMQTAVIADNVYFVRDILRNLLEMSGCTVVAEAEDGIEAVLKYTEMRPKMIFMDVILPLKNGVAATREIIAGHQDAKVVICSTKAHLKNAAAALEAGASAILFKPYNNRKIREVLQKLGVAGVEEESAGGIAGSNRLYSRDVSG